MVSLAPFMLQPGPLVAIDPDFLGHLLLVWTDVETSWSDITGGLCSISMLRPIPTTSARRRLRLCGLRDQSERPMAPGILSSSPPPPVRQIDPAVESDSDNVSRASAPIHLSQSSDQHKYMGRPRRCARSR